MRVWVVQTGYRFDYEVLGIFAISTAAEECRESHMAGLNESARQNPSYEAFVTEHEVK